MNAAPPVTKEPPLLLKAHGLSCIRGGRLVFSGVDLDLHAGESLWVRGPNGVGKSSLLRMLAGLLDCHRGGMKCSASLALADERPALDGMNRLRDALAFWTHMDGATDQSLKHAMAFFSLEALADIPVRLLSTGQRKRAILARTMASGARIWLLDEPGNGLDASSLAQLAAAMKAHVTGGGAILVASHFDLAHDFNRTIELGGSSQEDHTA